jgi:hypothetical protein
MTLPKIGDVVILITDSKEFVCEGVLELYCPDDEPLVIVSGKTYDLANEGETVDVIVKISK